MTDNQEEGLGAHQQITDVEAEIGELHAAVDRCRKIDLASKAVLVGGCVTVGIGFIWHSPLAVVIAIGAVLGSLALMGSNRRTLDETLTVLKAQEAKRSELIDGMELQEIQHEELDPRRHRLRSVGVQKL